MALSENIPIDITFPTRVALELRKRGLKCCAPHDLTVTKFRAVLIAHKYKGTVIYEIGMKIDRFGLHALCFIYGKNSPLAGLFKLPCNELPTVFGLDTKLLMKSIGLELTKNLIPGPPQNKISASDFRRIVTDLEHWIKHLQTCFVRLSDIV
jgi:hypothetical protein